MDVRSGSVTDGTASRVLEGADSTNRIEGSCVVPGYASDQSAYRSELAGLFGMAVILNVICKVHRIDKGNIELACDNESALLQVEHLDSPIAPDRLQFDMIAAARSWIKRSPVKEKFGWVEGHLDEKRPRKVYSRWTLLNFEMDENCKAYWHKHQENRDQFTQLKISSEPWTLEINSAIPNIHSRT
jgi:hypothetical protein